MARCLMLTIVSVMCGTLSFSALALEVSASVVPPYGLCVHRMHVAKDRAAAFPVMTSHGVGYVRCDFNWEWIEPAKGEWNFAPFDALLDDAEKQGLKVLPILHHGAAWTKPLMDHLDDWRIYVRTCIERYGRRIEAIEIWNEANIHAFPGPIGDYAKVLKIASEEIRAAAPQVKITTSGWAGVAIGHMEYLYRHVGREAFDIVNFHHYSFGERPNGELEDCNLASEIGRLRDLMTKYGDRDKPMWLTECGYPTHDPSLVLHNIFKVQLPVFDPDRRNWRVRMVTLGTETENMVEGYARLMKEELPAGSDFKFVRANRLAGKLKEGGIDVIILPFHEKMPDGCTDELLAFIRQGGVVAQFGEAAMSYVIPQDADGVCRFRGGAPNGAATRRRFGFDVKAQYADPSVPGRQTAITNAASGAMGTEGVTVGMWTMRAGIPCARWMTPVETKDLPGLEFTPLMTYTDGNGRAWTAAARLRLPGRKAGGLIISCGDEREENLYPATFARQARTLPRQYLYSQMLGCEDVFWYVYKTWEGTTDARRFNREPFFGIVRPNTEEPKPALVALKALAAARPVGSRTTPGLWRDEKTGFYFPQWTLPDGIPAGALWLRARTISEPPRGERTVSFGSDRMSFTDHLGRDITGAVKNLGGGRYALPLSEAVIYFRGGRFVTPAEEILQQHAGAAHPRLFDIPKEVDGRLVRAIVAAADSHLGQPPVERKFDESGRRLLQPAGRLHNRVIAFASAYRLTKDVRYVEAAKREMLAGAAWTDWNPHHWLDTATMLEAIAVGTDWLYDALDGETRATLRKACVEKGLRTIHAFEAETQHWRVGDNNWNTTCWGAVVMTILAFNGELPDWCGSLFSEAIDALPRPVLLMAPKGSYAEGPSYWGSIISHLLVVDCLESALGTSFGLADVPGLKETADYRSRMEGTSGYLFNYSDSGWGTPYVKRDFCLAQLWLAKRFNRHDAAVFDRAELGRLLDGDAAAAYGKLGVIPLLLSSWGITAPADADLKGPARPLDWYSGGTQPLVVMRSGDGPDAAYLGIKGGKSAASHGHDDSGTFVFDDAGVRWAVDLGSNPYQAIENTKINLWDNWAKEPTRWQVLRLSNRGHNVVTIDDQPYDNYGFADFTKREFGKGIASATLDLSHTFSRQAASAHRTFTLDRASRKMTVVDRMTGVRPGARVNWRLFTPAKAEVTREGVVLELGGRRKLLTISSVDAGSWSVRAANELRKEWDAALDGLTVVDYTLAAPRDGRVELIAGLGELVASDEGSRRVSPDGKNEIRICREPLSLEILRNGKTVVCRSRLGLTGGGSYEVETVARNDGVAYRFVSRSDGDLVVSNETAEVNFAPDVSYVLHKTTEIGCEENVVNFCGGFDEISMATNEVAYLPLLAEGRDFVCAVTDAGVRDYPIWNLKKSADGFCGVFARYPGKLQSINWVPNAESDGRRLRKYKVLTEEPYLVRTKGPRTFPWRVFALADKPSDLIGSTIVADLAGEQASGDFSWVRPGKVAWDWWNAFDNKGDPAGCTTATYERFIDFAASNGVEYVILDEGWSERLNIWKFHPNVDVPHLIEYAAKRNVGIILWMAWAQIKDDEERVAAHFAKLGAKGFKVDFMDSGDAMQERFLWKFAAACAKNRMIVDYHGVHRPTGLSKVYPNVLNWEGVHGLEQMKAFRGEDILANDVAIVFTRMLAGPMDYTPGAMDNFPVEAYPVAEKEVDVLTLPTWKSPGSLGTRARQMAMMVLYDAPLQMLCDAPTKYERNRECFSFMAKTPVVWADVVGIGGSPDTMAALARKSRDGVWYAAGIANAKARSFAFDTQFLGEGVWTAEIFRDAADSDRKPTHYVHERTTVKAGTEIAVDLMPGGGFVVRFEK